jgi:hypothetical protein
MTVTGGLEIPIALLLFGALLATLGVLLLGEYRRAFFENPRAVMSFEVFTQITQFGGTPGYLGVLLLFFSVFFIFAGLLGLVIPLALHVANLWSTLFPSSAG